MFLTQLNATSDILQTLDQVSHSETPVVDDDAAMASNAALPPLGMSQAFENALDAVAASASDMTTLPASQRHEQGEGALTLEQLAVDNTEEDAGDSKEAAARTSVAQDHPLSAVELNASAGLVGLDEGKMDTGDQERVAMSPVADPDDVPLIGATSPTPFARGVSRSDLYVRGCVLGLPVCACLALAFIGGMPMLCGWMRN